MYIVKPLQTLCQRSFTQVYHYQQFRKVPFSTQPLLGNLSGKKCYLTLISISLISCHLTAKLIQIPRTKLPDEPLKLIRLQGFSKLGQLHIWLGLEPYQEDGLWGIAVVCTHPTPNQDHRVFQFHSVLNC